jgi:hypothetical protein
MNQYQPTPEVMQELESLSSRDFIELRDQAANDPRRWLTPLGRAAREKGPAEQALYHDVCMWSAKSIRSHQQHAIHFRLSAWLALEAAR